MVRKYNQAKNRLTIYAAIRHSSCLILSSCLLNTCSVIPFIPHVCERDLRMATIWRKKKLLVNYFLYNLIYILILRLVFNPKLLSLTPIYSSHSFILYETTAREINIIYSIILQLSARRNFCGGRLSWRMESEIPFNRTNLHLYASYYPEPYHAWSVFEFRYLFALFYKIISLSDQFYYNYTNLVSMLYRKVFV